MLPRSSLILFISLLLVLTLGCFRAFPAKSGGAYRGKIVEAETREPIEGVIILGIWFARGMGNGVYYDAHETVTDKKGDFWILPPAASLTGIVLDGRLLEPMSIVIFKAGYEHLGLMPWDSFKEDTILKERIKWEGTKPIIPLRKLTPEERTRKPNDPYIDSSIPKEKRKLMDQEIDKEYQVFLKHRQPQEPVTSPPQPPPVATPTQSR